MAIQSFKNQLRFRLLRRQVGDDGHQQPGRIGGRLDGRHPQASQHIVRNIARKHPIEAFGDLSTQLPGLAAFIAAVATVLAVVTRISAIVLADFAQYSRSISRNRLSDFMLALTTGKMSAHTARANLGIEITRANRGSLASTGPAKKLSPVQGQARRCSSKVQGLHGRPPCHGK